MRRAFSGKIILIVGGSEGIGLAIARLLSTLDCRIVLAARDAGKLQRAHAALTGNPAAKAAIHVFRVDVMQADSVNALRDDVLAQVGTPTHVINCAGRAIAAYLEDQPLADYRAMMDLNFMGTVHVSHAFLPAFRERGSGHLVHTASILGFMGLFGVAAYAASKHAVVGYCESIYSEYRKHGVHVSVLCPPATLTPGFEEENKTKPPAVRKAEEFIAPVQAELVGRALLKAIARKRFMVVPTLMGQLVYRAGRWLPGLVRFVGSDK